MNEIVGPKNEVRITKSGQTIPKRKFSNYFGEVLKPIWDGGVLYRSLQENSDLSYIISL